MSAREISSKQINLVLAWCRARTRFSCIKYEGEGWKTFSLGDIGRAIATANMAHIAHTREEPISGHNYVYRDLCDERSSLDAVQCLKFIEGIRYNCEDAPSYQGSNAQYFIEHLMISTIRALPGYESAEWSID